MEPKTLTVIQHNVFSWNTYKFSLMNIYRQIDPDVILINAHGIKTGQQLKIQHYNVYKTNNLNTHNSGTAIAIKSNLTYRIKEDYYSDLRSIQIETNLGPIVIATEYIPPRTGYLHYPDYFQLFTSQNPVYFLGDINARSTELGNSNNNIAGNQIKKLIDRKHAIHVGPDFPTFITHRSKSSPDIILTNRAVFHNILAVPGPLTPSDHIPIIFKISTNPIMLKIPKRPSFKAANWNNYKTYLEDTPIYQTEHKTIEEIETLVDKITEHIQEASRKHIPEITYRTIPHFHRTPLTRQLQTENDALLNTINRLGPNPQRNRSLRNLREQLKQEYQRLRGEMWEQLIEKTDTLRNSKDFWYSIKRMMGGNNRQEQKYLKGHNGEDVYEEEEREALFRNYWSTIFKISEEENEEFDKAVDKEVKKHIKNNRNYLKTDETVNLGILRLETELITEQEIKRTIKTFKQRAPGQDKITKYHLDHLPPNIITNLTSILNACLTIGHFPKQWKNSIMIFIPKGNKSPLHHINYRPISLLSILGKLFEKLINSRLTENIEELNLVNKRQHGFIKNRGTDTATGLLYEQIATAKANRYKINIVLRDIGKAFDKVWHQGLIYKLMKNNIPKFLVRILNSYLENRTARIKINTFIGPPFRLMSGVPQGGCLSPALFNFYTHDLPDPTAYSEHIIYADDITQIITYPGTERMLAAISRNAIDSINRFEHQWKIKTNINKFQIIPIARKNTTKITLNNKTYDMHNEGTVLGVTLTKQGFTKHATGRINKAKGQLGKLFRFRHLSMKNKRKIYIATIRSILEYPPIILHAQSTTTQKKMQIIQNKAARIITNTRRLDRKTNVETNQRAQLEPVNMVIHKRAQKIWTKIDTLIPQEIAEKIILLPNRSYQEKLPSSKIKSENNVLPLY